MNRSNKMIALAMTVIVMLTAACGNANAQKTEKKNDAAVTVKAKELSTDEFNRLVFDMTKEKTVYLGDKPAIVDFTAKWCGPCQRIAPILDQLATEYKGQIVVYKVDIDKNQELARAFGISSIPAILYIPTDGEPSMTVGSRDKARFQNEINKILLGK
jgi:thioredoxin